MKKIILVTLIMLFAAQFAAAGPFGLEKGMGLREVAAACGGKAPEQISEGCYFIEPEKKHGEFDMYIAWIDKTEGLNYIKAVGDFIDCDKHGSQIRSRFSDMLNRLSDRYGKAELVDRTRSSLGLFTEDEYWMYTLRNGDRVLFSCWYDNLPDGFAGIVLAVEAAETGDKARLCLEYEFSNYIKVQQAMDKAL